MNLRFRCGAAKGLLMDSFLARIAARFWATASASLLLLLLSACAAPQATPVTALLHDELFPAPGTLPDASNVFTLSHAMRAYADTELAGALRGRDPRRALIEALYAKGRLRLDYDGTLTRNAAEAFADRAGNCLSLVIMTASFARHLGLPTSFQSVLGDDFYSRSGQLTLASGHVNLVLDQLSRAGFDRDGHVSLTVDFLSQDELRGQRTRALAEATVVAMYMNNRAAEFLVEGRLAEAYAFARAALHSDPGFHAAANTLGVIYSRGAHSAPASLPGGSCKSAGNAGKTRCSSKRTGADQRSRPSAGRTVVTGGQLVVLQPAISVEDSQGCHFLHRARPGQKHFVDSGASPVVRRPETEETLGALH